MVYVSPLQQHVTSRHWLRPRCGRRPLPQIQSLLLAMHIATMAEERRTYKQWSHKYDVKEATIRALLSRHKHLRIAVVYEENIINRSVGERFQQAIGKKTIEYAGLVGYELRLRADPERKEIIIARA